MLVLLQPRGVAGQLPDEEPGSALENAVATAPGQLWSGESRPENAAGGWGPSPLGLTGKPHAPCRWLNFLGDSVSTVVTPQPGRRPGARLSWSFTPVMD